MNRVSDQGIWIESDLPLTNTLDWSLPLHLVRAVAAGEAATLGSVSPRLASNLETISLKENDFLRTDISLHPVAVSVESMTLKKGETSRVFVVERNEGGQP